MRAELIAELHKLDNRDDCNMAYNLLRAQMDKVEEAARGSFVVGQEVTFTSKKRGGITLLGRIEKINKKSISVYVAKSDRGYPEVWKVHPSLLSPASNNKKKSATA